MPRPKEFDVDTALDQALDLFWLQGYHQTSTRNLVARLDIGRQSLYDTFGGKRELYLRSLDRYMALKLESHLTNLELPSSSRAQILEYFAAMVELLDSESPRKGCFMANMIAESSSSDAELTGRATAFLKRLENGFVASIERDLRHGEMEECHDPRAVARSLTATVLGMSMAARAGASRESLVDMVSVAVRPLY